MPRHNLSQVKPHIEALCRKHGATYVSKPLLKAFQDIPTALDKYGQIWYEAYFH